MYLLSRLSTKPTLYLSLGVPNSIWDGATMYRLDDSLLSTMSMRIYRKTYCGIINQVPGRGGVKIGLEEESSWFCPDTQCTRAAHTKGLPYSGIHDF